MASGARKMANLACSYNDAFFLSDAETVRHPVGLPLEDKDTLSGYSEASWKNIVRAGLTKLGNLPTNWDSYGASKVESWALISAWNILNGIMRDSTPVPWIVPINDGRVQIEWHIGNIDLEIEILTPVDFCVSFHDLLKREQKEFMLAYDVTPLSNYIRLLTDRTRT